MPTLPTARLARFSRDFARGAYADELVRRATRAFVDTLGVTIAGAAEETCAILARTLEDAPGTGVATVFSNGSRASAETAALLNGTAAHALDMDDGTDVLMGHPSSVLVPALVALAESVGASGSNAIDAYMVGFETACAIARALPVLPHYMRGWHSTATVGVVAAAVACSRLLGLSEERTRMAIGIAASRASGSRANFGTMTKPLHAGLAARDAVFAARLASNGFTADPAQLEAPLGYFAMYGDAFDAAAFEASLDGTPALVAVGINVKRYACCYRLTRTIDAALQLADGGLALADIARVTVALQPDAMTTLAHHRPENGLEAKFSVEYAVVAALLDGKIGLETFSDESVRRPEAQRMLDRVHPVEERVPPFGVSSFEHAYATVEASTVDGRTLRARSDVPRGDRRAPLTDAEISGKYLDCVASVPNVWDARATLAALWALDDASVVADAFVRATANVAG